MPQLSEEQLAELKETFEHFDADNNGRIDRQEFGSLLEALGAEMSTEEADIGFDIIDADGSTTIDFDEFLAWWAEK